MSTDENSLQKYANELFKAWERAEQIEPITDALQSLSIEEAYKIQLKTINKRIANGETHVGKKIGITAKAVQTMLGVDQPDFGHLMSGMRYNEGDLIPFDQFCQPKGEGEIAFLLNKDLNGPGVTATQVIAATEYVTPSFEIVDSRIDNWKIKIQDTVADNASAGAFVLGT